MSFDFPGHVLRAPQLAEANSPTSSEPASGVVRAIQAVPNAYTLNAQAPPLVEPQADQYRAAVLNAPGRSTTEYLVWAQNTAQLTIREDPSWYSTEGRAVPSSGSITVPDTTPSPIPPGLPPPVGYGTFFDGTRGLVVTDNGLRSISRVLCLVIARGDEDFYVDQGWVDPDNTNLGRAGSNPYLVLTLEDDEQDADAGSVELNDSHAALLGGGFSRSRGDQVIEVRYRLAASRFWWTRNDRYTTRFGWDGKLRRWRPWKGGSVVTLGPLLENVVYRLAPSPKGFPLNTFLPGSVGAADAYAMLRLGPLPDENSLPVGSNALGLSKFQGVRVVQDAAATSSFDFTLDPFVSGVVGATNGNLIFNPAYVAQHLGQTVWYAPATFTADSNGIVGLILGSGLNPLFISPPPEISDYPFLKLGSRRPLAATVFGDETSMLTAKPPREGEVYVAASTGRVVLSAHDIAKADPTQPTFDKHYLGEYLIYDGVALNQRPQPCRDAAVVTSGLVPNATLLPDDFVSANPTRGLGVSGIVDIYDGTGALPALPVAPGTARPGGDNSGDPSTGRVRAVSDGVGDSILFSRKVVIKNLVVKDYLSELPTLPFTIPQGTAYISRSQALGGGSPFVLSSADREIIGADAIYFAQTTLTPATYTTSARLASRIQNFYTLNPDDTLYFAIDGISYTWVAAVSTETVLTPTQVAESIQTILGGSAYATVIRGRLVLGSTAPGGSVEIGFGTGQNKDLSGAAALGFLPGWIAVEGVDNWLPDSGVSVGLYRNQTNLDRTSAVPDYSARDRVEDMILQESVSPNPFVFVDQRPLQDVAGYSDGVFFSTLSTVLVGDVETTVHSPLEHYKNIQHDFTQNRFAWLGQTSLSIPIKQPSTLLDLGHPNIVPESMLGAPGIGGGLSIAPEGGEYVPYAQGVQYVLPGSGVQGVAEVVTAYGYLLRSGTLGSYTAGTPIFTDLTVDFAFARPGYRLKLPSGSYTIESAVGNNLVVSPTPTTTSTHPIPWEIYHGYPDSSDTFDSMVVADFVYREFNHLPVEPFQIRTLTKLGRVGSAVLQATLSRALDSGRLIHLRFGLEAATSSNTAVLVPLKSIKLGTIANNVLVIPDTTSLRFAAGKFVVRIGTQSVEATGVLSFSPDPGGGEGVEYLLEDYHAGSVFYPKGSLRFGTGLLSKHQSAEVWQVERFNNPSALVAHTAEYDPQTGTLNLSSSDLLTFAGKDVYFVEQMVTEGRADVALSPLTGSFAFREPLGKGKTIEAVYWLADLTGKRIGDQIQEFLPLYIQNEEASRLNSNVYYFNVNGEHSIDHRVVPIVYIGPVLQNSRPDQDYLLDYPNDLAGVGRLTFTREIRADLAVKVSYAVFDSLGGEQIYTASQKPIYRPPFFLEAGVSRFGLRGDRTDHFTPGQLLRIGADCFYIRGVTYYPPRTELPQVAGSGPMVLVQKGDVTALDIFPPTNAETGSRSPGNDVLTLVTERPVTRIIDPKGVSPTVLAGVSDHLYPAPWTIDPITKGQNILIAHLNGPTNLPLVGSVLEILGRPYTIAQVEVSEDGRRLTITLTTAVTVSVASDVAASVRYSQRPIYPPGVRTFVGLGPVEETQPLELVLYGEKSSSGDTLPGRTLARGVEYDLDPSTGVISLLDPLQAPLRSDQRLLFRHTRIQRLGPVQRDGDIVFPRYKAEYLFHTTPDVLNGYLGARLAATYTFENPDTYYFRVVPLSNYLAEVAQAATQEIASKLPAGGAVKTNNAQTKNWQHGRTGFLAGLGNLYDIDRAARTFLDFYNTTINAFEQITETISGALVGDHNGKFRFSVGRGLDYPPPGSEDPISGLLNPRNLWEQVTLALNPALDIHYLPGDPVVDPATATLASGVVTGSFINSGALNGLLFQQLKRVANEVDDVVLLGIGSTTQTALPTPPYFQMLAEGRYSRMGDSHVLSRIFPRLTKAFFVTYPGIDAQGSYPGTYNWRKWLTSGTASTHQQPIAQLANPVLGPLTHVANSAISRRRARARIWGYFPLGIPAGAFPGPSPAIPAPCVIATPLPLSSFPIDPQTGYPDVTQLLSQGGTLADLQTGDASLAVPGFAAGDQITWGRPDGSVHAAFALDSVTLYGKQSLIGLVVADVRYGCVLTFADADGNAIADPSKLLVGTGPDTGVPADSFGLQQGDSVFVGPVVGVSAPPTDPPTLSVLQQAAGLTDGFRMGFDLDVRSDGTVRDLSLPSLADPFFPIKELLGQNTAKPMEHLEGTVEFTYTGQNPLRIPALLGGSADDSGDYRVPYLRTYNTEIDRFGQIGTNLPQPIVVEDAAGKAIYPDEILGNDGVILDEITNWPGALIGGGVYQEPATLLTSKDVFAYTHGAPNSGLGDVSRYDLLLVQVKATGPVADSTQGFLTVGEAISKNVGGGQYESFIEPPRFVTQTTPPPDNGFGSNLTGSLMRYVFTNAISFLNDSYPAQPQVTPPDGVVLIEDSGTGYTILDFSAITKLALNNGWAAGTGNFNDLWSMAGGDPRANNIITITLYARTDPDISLGPIPTPGNPIYSIQIHGGTVTGYDPLAVPHVGVVGVGGVVFGTNAPVQVPVLNNRQIRIHALGIIDFQGANAVDRAQWYLPHGLNGGVKTSLYGYEFSISVDTYNPTIPVGPGPTVKGGSLTAFIGEDRLSFCDVIDLRHTKKRGTTHPLQANTALEGRLLVYDVLTSGGVASTVNLYANGVDAFNNPQPFTFLPRSPVASAPSDYYALSVGGLWSPAQLGIFPLTPERGRIKVMACEGFNNLPNPSTGSVTFSAVPSNTNMPGLATAICRGTGYTEAASDTSIPAAARPYYDNRITEVTVTAGAVTNIEAGDLLVVKQSADATHWGTNKAGTYLVRQAIDASVGVPLGQETKYRWLALDTAAGSGAGWVPFKFPKLLSFDYSNLVDVKLTASDLAAFTDAPTIGVVPSAFSSSGTLYVIRSLVDIGSSDLGLFQKSVLVATYTSVTTGGSYPVFSGLSNFKYADGTGITAAVFAALVTDAAAGTYSLSGMSALPVRISGPGLPNNNVVGYDDQTIFTVHGFRWLTLEPPSALGLATPIIFNGQNGAGVTPTTGEIRKSTAVIAGSVVVRPGTVNGVDLGQMKFVSDPHAVIYPGVPNRMDIDNLTAAQWDSLNIPPASAGVGVSIIRCLLPGTSLRSENPGLPANGFYAQAGVFLEPSFPTSVFDLNELGGTAHVVDHHQNPPDHTLPVSHVGMRNTATFVEIGVDAGGIAYTPPITPEHVTFEIRRIRRFHQTLSNIAAEFVPLRYAYEIRRGRITTYSPTTAQSGIVESSAFTMTWNADNPLAPRAPDIWNDGDTYTGTNLGAFDNQDVNIHPGDLFRVLDDTGTVVEEVEVQAVIGPSQIKLAAPGLQKLGVPAAYTGARFEVYLRQAPVPHEQSAAQLLDLITSKVVHQTIADYSAQKGGYVPVIVDSYENAVNLLFDDLAADGSPGNDFTALGVRSGDIVLVDPLGTLSNGERGAPPTGDLSIAPRVLDYVAGSPNPLDDNRGFYRVVDVLNDQQGPHLVVTGQSTFTGDQTTDVLYPDDAAQRPVYGYTLYPTVNNSALNALPYTLLVPVNNREGQMDLRPTKLPDSNTGSYQEYTVDAPGAAYSIRPFSYTVIRPSSLFSAKTIDVVLMLRERILSLIELFRSAMSGTKAGTYFILQRDHHLHDLGLTSDPNTGKGVFSNALIESLLGKTDTVPFTNTRTGLSVLDRRFWILDRRLDSLTSAGPFTSKVRNPLVDTPYTAYDDTVGSGSSVRPVLPDRIHQILTVEERLRDIRFTWLAYRTHRVAGTLVRIDQYAAALSRQMEEQSLLLNVGASISKAPK